MTYLDAGILNAVEWFCHKVQRLTGRTNVWLAAQVTNLTIVMYFVWAVMYFWNTEFSVRISVGLFCGALLYVLPQTVFKVSIEEHENNAYRRVAKGVRNPRRLRDVLLRISFLTLSIVLLYPVLFVYLYPGLSARVKLQIGVVLLSYLLIVLTTVLLYLLACDPLPPCAGRVKEWLQKLVPARPAVSETPPAG
jgi:hypothetical protein